MPTHQKKLLLNQVLKKELVLKGQFTKKVAFFGLVGPLYLALFLVAFFEVAFFEVAFFEVAFFGELAPDCPYLSLCRVPKTNKIGSTSYSIIP